MAKKKHATVKQSIPKKARAKPAKKNVQGKSPSKGRVHRKASTRETINTGRDTRYVRRDEQGEFEDVVEKGRSLAHDRRKKAKKVVPAGQGDRGDQKVRKKQRMT